MCVCVCVSTIKCIIVPLKIASRDSRFEDLKLGSEELRMLTTEKKCEKKKKKKT